MRYRVHLQIESSLDIEADSEEEALAKAGKVPLESKAWTTILLPPVVSCPPQPGERVRVRLEDGSVCRGVFQRHVRGVVQFTDEESSDLAITFLDPEQEKSYKPSEDETLVEYMEILLDNGKIVHNDGGKYCDRLEEGTEPPTPAPPQAYHLEVPEIPDDDILHLVAYDQPKPS